MTKCYVLDIKREEKTHVGYLPHLISYRKQVVEITNFPLKCYWFQADSGGPLMWLNGNQYFLIGIVSYGPTICGTPGIPGVYTNVTSFVDWIHEKISS